MEMTVGDNLNITPLRLRAAGERMGAATGATTGTTAPKQ
jgi:hypothetical protein